MSPGRTVLRRMPAVAVAGGVGWLVDAAVLWSGHELLGLPVALAAATGFVAGGVVNVALNRRTFQGAGGRLAPQTVRYLVLFLLNLALTTVLVPLLADLLEGADVPGALLLAKVAVTAVLLPVNAVAYQWVFRAQGHQPEPVRSDR